MSEESEHERESEKQEKQPERMHEAALDELRGDTLSEMQSLQRPASDPENLELTLGAQFPWAPKSAFALGQSWFQYKKSEFLRPEIEKPLTQVTALLDKFFNDTPWREDEDLTPAEKSEMSHTRESLARSSTAEEALSQALHLARLYRHLRYLDEAKKAVELALGIDEKNTTAKELLKELERIHPADLAAIAVPLMTLSLTKSQLRRRIQALSGGRVIVVGDMLIDELVEGRPERISREAPVLILEHVDTELIPGGAANTANNIASLGGRCHAVGVCGKDEYAGRLAHLFDRSGIKHSLVEDATRPTTVKTRILSKSHSFRQQLIRLDRIAHDPIDTHVQEMLLRRLRAVAADYRALILSDYRAGVITDNIILACRKIAQESNLMVVVDAQDKFERFQGVTLLTPNQPDTERAVGFEINSRETLKRAGEQMLAMTGAQALLLTRGSKGMVLFQKDQGLLELPVFNRSDIFDVTGAGDTVVATMTLGLVTGCSFAEAMALGNLAAGIVVRKPGTAVTTQRELLENLEMIDMDEG